MSIDEVNYFGANPHFAESLDDTGADFAPDEQVGDDDFQKFDLFADGAPSSYTHANVLRGAWAEIDLDAIAHNTRIARRRIGPTRMLMSVVKADAYGHGAVPVAKTALANGADYLAVATVEEGVELRQAGIEAPILMLSQPPMRAIPYLLMYDIMPTVTASDFALALGEEADRHRRVAKYHLAVDTGMNRIGVFYLDVVDFVESINFHRGLQLEGTFTHFATADEETDWDFRIQLQRFNEALQLMRNARIDPGIVHCANSASIERYPEAYFDMVRQGITLYGLDPSPCLRGMENLKPAMAVKAQVSFVKEPQMGEGVSYVMTYRVAKPVQIATVPLGYADGLRRKLSGRMKVLLQGRPCRQVGRICMDQMMIEVPLDYTLRNRGAAEVGDEVVIIGTQGSLEVTADMMADELDTINYEITCGFGLRLPRIYLHDGADVKM